MKAIIDNKLYDTEKAELVYSYRLRLESGLTICGLYPLFNYHDVYIYKTPKGTYFEHDKDAETLTLKSDMQIRTLIQKLDLEKYMALFDPTIEEG